MVYIFNNELIIVNNLGMIEHTAFNSVQYRLNTKDSMLKTDNACFLLIVKIFNKI